MPKWLPFPSWHFFHVFVRHLDILLFYKVLIQAFTHLEWVTSFSRVWLFATPWTVTDHAPSSMGFSRQKYWSGVPFPSQRIFPTQGLNPGLPHCRQTLYPLSHQESPLCDPMNHCMPGLPVHHQLPEFTQTQVHQVSDAIQPSHLLSSPSPPAPNPSQHQGLFQWVNSLHQVAKVLEFQLQHQSFQWTPRTDHL